MDDFILWSRSEHRAVLWIQFTVFSGGVVFRFWKLDDNGPFMKTNPIPTKYNRVMPYLTVKNATGFIEFTKAVFGAQEMGRMGPPGGPVMHGEIRIGDSVVMLCDASDENPPESNVLMIYVEDCDATYAHALKAGAKSRGEPVNQFYGDRIAKIEDPFGIHWAISSRLEDLSEDEIRRRARGNH
jgi:PhnB protein